MASKLSAEFKRIDIRYLRILHKVSSLFKMVKIKFIFKGEGKHKIIYRFPIFLRDNEE